MNEEYNASIKNKKWSLVSLPSHKNIFGCKWTYKLKRIPDGSILKYKSRLVAKGYSQEFDFDLMRIFHQ